MEHLGQTFRFPKKEKLTGKKSIEELFKRGSSFYLYPLLVKYRHNPQSDADCHQALFSVSKRHFKRAVDRNLLKRRMREAYRLNKHLISNNPPFYHIAFVYLDKTILPYERIEEKLKVLLLRLQNQQTKTGDKKKESKSPKQ